MSRWARLAKSWDESCFVKYSSSHVWIKKKFLRIFIHSHGKKNKPVNENIEVHLTSIFFPYWNNSLLWLPFACARLSFPLPQSFSLSCVSQLAPQILNELRWWRRKELWMSRKQAWSTMNSMRLHVINQNIPRSCTLIHHE